MITAIGTIITCLSVLGFGWSYSLQLKREKQSLKGIIALIDRIKTRIECFRQVLPEIYKGFSDDILDKTGFTEDLKRDGLHFALIKNRHKLGLKSEELESVIEFASALGKSYAEDQIRLCIVCRDGLAAQLDRVDQRLPSRIRLSLTLSAAIAAMTAIMLL